MVISIVYMYFRFWSGVVNPIAPEELPVDGNAWTTLSYGNGPGYDWGFRKDPNTVDTSKSNPWKCEIEIRDLTCFWSLKRKTFFANMRWDWWGCVGGSVKEQPISIKWLLSHLCSVEQRNMVFICFLHTENETSDYIQHWDLICWIRMDKCI